MDRPRLLDGVFDHRRPWVRPVADDPPRVRARRVRQDDAARRASPTQQRAAGLPVAWVTCDRDDDARAAFWSAVVAASSEAAGRPAAVPRRAARAPHGPADAAFVVDPARRPARRGSGARPRPRRRSRGAAPRRARRHPPPRRVGRPGSVRVALGCRFEPPIGLHRLRLTGRLHEVRAAQLAFTAEEADDFWDRHDLTLDRDAAQALLTLTEGWPAGLRLAALSLEGGDDPARFVEEFSGADRPGRRLPHRRDPRAPARGGRRLPPAHIGRRGAPGRPRRAPVRPRGRARPCSRTSPSATPSPPGSTGRNVVPLPRAAAHLPRRRAHPAGRRRGRPACTASPRGGSSSTTARRRRSSTPRRPGTRTSSTRCSARGAWACCWPARVTRSTQAVSALPRAYRAQPVALVHRALVAVDAGRRRGRRRGPRRAGPAPGRRRRPADDLAAPSRRAAPGPPGGRPRRRPDAAS